LKDNRAGESLWEEWIGEGFYLQKDSNIIYVTYDEVDITNEIVRRALASCLQRDGVFDSLSDSFRSLETSIASQGYIGFVDEEKFPVVTNEIGETEDGDEAEFISQATWIELSPS
jgi:hypothetical protein